MKFKKLLIYSLLLTSTISLTGCDFDISSLFGGTLSVDDISTKVYGEVNLKINNLSEDETYTLSTAGDGIRIDNEDTIVPIKAGTDNEVTLTTSSGKSTTFNVNVVNRTYTSTHADAESSEGWFNDVSINKIDSMASSFANGMDISSCKRLYDQGQKFYNFDGEEESLFYILKDAGVNWVRLRLWNDPYDRDSDGNITYSYGGGYCDLENVTWMAHEAKSAGLKILLNFHYSDFWCDPSKQVIPKAWANITTSDDMASAIEMYTKETLLTLKNNDALPDMVQIGNETYQGMLLQNPGGSTSELSGNEPKYITGRSTASSSIAGKYDYTDSTSSNANLIKYVNAAINGINSVNPSILKMVHFVKGLSDPQTSIKFFTLFKNMNIDVFGLSAYSYYHWSNITTLKNGLTAISEAFPNKKIAIAETSYGFTYEQDSRASNSFYSSGTCSPISGYAANIQGQASIIRDATEVVSDLSNGFGVFYWEGAWTPTKNSGWADDYSNASWSNQALFSYNGKALGSLKVYSKMQSSN